MQFTIRQSAGRGIIFTQNAFESQIGKTVPLNLRENDDGPIKGTLGVARLVKADIIEGGHAVELTFETVDEIPRFEPPTGMSFSFT
jgi:hypothetical protein